MDAINSNSKKEENQLPADFALHGFKKGETNFRLLYKYYTINDYSLDALKNGYLYFSSLDQLNDPMDPFISMLGSSKDEFYNELMQKEYRIFCLTETDYNPLMWAHYGNAGAGMCIAYAVSLHSPSLFQKVTYTDKIPKKLNIINMVSTKISLWSYEQEWRAIFSSPEPKKYDLAHPYGIYLGPKCSHTDMERVKKVMPDTVEEFYKIYPAIHKEGFAYPMYDAQDVINRFGKIPKLSEYYSKGGM